MARNGTLHNKKGEHDVTVRIHGLERVYMLTSAYFTEELPVAMGVPLDPDAEDEFESGRPVINLVIFGFSGMATQIEAFINSERGTVTILKAVFEKPVTLSGEERFELSGPAYGVIGL